MSSIDQTQQYFSRQIQQAQIELKTLEENLSSLNLTLSYLKATKDELLDKIFHKNEAIIELLFRNNTALLKEYTVLKEKENLALFECG